MAGAKRLRALPSLGAPHPTITPLLAVTLAAVTQVPDLSATAAQDAPAQPEAAQPLPTLIPEFVQPTPTLPPLPSPTPAHVLLQLTSGGCCVQPFWAPDGQHILFLDKPSPDAPAGIWRVDLAGGAPQLFTDRLGIYSADFSLRAFPLKGQTFIERMADGERWVIANGGRSVSFSPDGARIAWVGGSSGPPFDTPQRQIWISNVDGSQARLVHTMFGGGFSGWFPDGRMLVNGRLSGDEEGQALWALTLPAEEGGEPQLVELARGGRLRSVTLSPDGAWLAYVVTFSSDSAEDGLWLVNTLTLEQRRLDIFGAFRWRDGQRLLVIPLDLEQTVHRLFQVQAASGQIEPLTDPAVTPLRIASGDWSVSPDGNRVIFVSALDYNIWLLTLP